jgi:hypothetical protein
MLRRHGGCKERRRVRKWEGGNGGEVFGCDVIARSPLPGFLLLCLSRPELGLTEYCLVALWLRLPWVVWFARDLDARVACLWSNECK